MSQPTTIYSVFLSSTSSDLIRYRARARDILLTYNLHPLGMEYFPAEPGTTSEALYRYLDAADGVVLIAGARYGSVNQGQSYVEWEFQQALTRGLPVLCLIMSEEERSQQPGVPAMEREKQERFIARLKEHSKVAEFDQDNFDIALAGALRLFPDHFRRDAGLIRATHFNASLASANTQIQDLIVHRKLIRLVAAIGLARNRQQPGGENYLMQADSERAALDRLLDLIFSDLQHNPAAARIIDRLIGRLIDRVHGFTGTGYVPDSVDELQIIIDELFAGTLSTLKATSIHSNHDALANYKGYWQDPKLGPFFKNKNNEFLARAQDRALLRVFVCDSVANSVAEAWFASTVIQQIAEGASVKVVEIEERKISSYEDFGIYEHGSGNNRDEAYLLLAPRDLNTLQNDLSTVVTADRTVVSRYSRDFDSLWAQSDSALEVVASAKADQADTVALGIHGNGRVDELFERHVILRSMVRLDTSERLLASSAGTIRKYQPLYAQTLSRHLKRRFPRVDHVIYVGDTHKNDGTAIRNLQALGWLVNGFICEPKLGIASLLFNDVLYTDRWVDLVTFADRISDLSGTKTLAIFDIDQTVWAPKGVHEGPLANIRTRAMSRLIEDYVLRPDGELARMTRARISLLYRELADVKYLSLTLDNEDFKAIICIFLGLNLVFDPRRLEPGGREPGGQFFEELGGLDAQDFTDMIRETYFPRFTRGSDAGEASIVRFIMETLSAAQTFQFRAYAEEAGIRLPRVIEDLERAFREAVSKAPIQYPAFRAKELEEALRSASERTNFSDQLVLNKPVWDFATWLRERGVALLALSDRPDEATIAADGRSLLEAPLAIYGKDITAFLPGG